MGQELYAGLLGQSFGFLHLYERGGGEELLDLARRYLEAGLDALEHSSVPRPEEWISFHGSGAAPALAAAVYDRLGDERSRDLHLAHYRRIASRAGELDFPIEDLLWGRGGFFFGAAWLRRRLGPECVPDGLVLAALEQLLSTGRRHARAHAADLTPGPHGIPPLLYMNFQPFLFAVFARSLIGSASRPARAVATLAARALLWAGNRREGLSHRYDIGLVHGLAGSLYLMMHFPELAAQVGASADLRASLDCLADCVEAERGLLELLPSRHSTPGAFTDKVHWCNGTTGFVFLFARAYEVFGAESYLAAASRAADHVWRFGLLRKGNGICHGISGNGYAFLTLHRVTGDDEQLDRALHFARLTWSDRVNAAQLQSDHPWSLYEGLMGTLCFYRDCIDPGGSRFPAFEV